MPTIGCAPRRSEARLLGDGRRLNLFRAANAVRNHLGRTIDGCLVIVQLTPAGRTLTNTLFPAFNLQGQHIASPIDPVRRDEFAEMLRLVTSHAEKPE